MLFAAEDASAFPFEFWISVLAICISGITAILTFVYVQATNRLVNAQTLPCVIVYTEISKVNPRELDIIIENVGWGNAYNVRFEPRGQLFSCTRGQEAITDGPLVDGIPALPPKTRRVIPWGTYDMLSELTDSKFVLECFFYRDAASQEWEHLPPTTNYLEYKSFLKSRMPRNELVETLRELSRVLRDYPRNR